VIELRLDGQDGQARAGRLLTPQGPVETPVFMPVGTRAAVRGMTPDQLQAAGATIVLANTYHLWLQPGERLVEKAGGLHAFMRWDGPILTDSGGFQVFSLPKKTITSEGVRFYPREEDGGEREGRSSKRSTKKAEPVLLTPERAIEIQHALGADMIMPLDECTPHPADHALAARGVDNTVAWLKRAIAAHADHPSTLFGIVQGSVYPDLRSSCAARLVELDLPAYAIGGVSVGEGHEALKKIVQHTAPQLPSDRPRYLMGVGLPEDLVVSVQSGMDMFDCVIPTRYARSATLFTRRGRIRMTRRAYRNDFYPIDVSCSCYACGQFTRAYVHHLYAANEILGTVLGAIHNVSFYIALMRDMRQAILEKRFERFVREFMESYLPHDTGEA